LFGVLPEDVMGKEVPSLLPAELDLPLSELFRGEESREGEVEVLLLLLLLLLGETWWLSSFWILLLPPIFEAKCLNVAGGGGGGISCDATTNFWQQPK